MANFIQQFNAGGITYDLHDSEFIIDTRTASGAALTGETKAAALFDGMQITFWMNYAAASNATLNLTLADGTTTGAIPCYYSGTTRLGTHYGAGNAVHFTYRENVTIGSTTIAAGWWGDANYSASDTNYDIVGTSIPIKTRLNAYCLCAMVGTSGTIAKQTNTVGAGTYWQINAFTQSSGTSTSKKLVPNQGYYPGKILYYTGSSAITDAGSVSGTISGSTSNVDLRYTVNGSTSTNIGVTGAPFFLVGTLGSDGLFYPKGHDSQATKEWWQCGFPTDLTSTYVYWYVGMMSSKYQCRLSDTNWMLKSDGTKWVVFDGAMKVYWDSIEGKPSAYTPASHAHGYISNDGAVAPSVSASPASGDKILISDLTDSNKVKGGPEIGSNDGKYLRHDGTWGGELFTIEVFDHSKDPTWDGTGTQWEVETPWADVMAAVSGWIFSNDPKIVLLQTHHYAEEGDALYRLNDIHSDDGAIFVQGYRFSENNDLSATLITCNVIVLAVMETTGTVLQGIEVNIPLLSPPLAEGTLTPVDGTYSLNVSSGVSSWTTAGSGGGNRHTIDFGYDGSNYSLVTSQEDLVSWVAEYQAGTATLSVRVLNTSDDSVKSYYPDAVTKQVGSISILVGYSFMPAVFESVGFSGDFLVATMTGASSFQVVERTWDSWPHPGDISGHYILYNSSGIINWGPAVPFVYARKVDTNVYNITTSPYDSSISEFASLISETGGILVVLGDTQGNDHRMFLCSVVDGSISSYPHKCFGVFDNEIFCISEIDTSNGQTTLTLETFYQPQSSTVLTSYTPGGLPELSYTSETSSHASLSNGLLSFGDVTSSSISAWDAGSNGSAASDTNFVKAVTPSI